MVLLSLFYIPRVPVISDLMSLVPAHNEPVARFKDAVERFGTTDLLLIGVEIGAGADLEDTLDYVDLLAEHLEAIDEIQWVDYHLEQLLEGLHEIADVATLFMPTDRLKAYLNQFKGEGLQQALDRLEKSVKSPLEIGWAPTPQLDPMGARAFMPELNSPLDYGPRIDPESGFFISSDHKWVLLLAKPDRPAVDVPYGRALMSKVQALVDRTNKEWAEDDSTVPEVHFGGGYPIAVEDSKLVMEDLFIGLSFSILAVALIFFIAFRHKRSLLIAFVPLFSGLIVAAGLGLFLLGSLNTLTASFGALLTGLGIDFVIVLYSRYLEERTRGVDHNKALNVMAEHTSQSVFFGATTTAVTFFAFLSSDFKGLSDLGLLTGTGILVLLVVVYPSLAALLTLLKHEERKRVLWVPGVPRLVQFSVKHPVMILIIGAVFTALFSWQARKVIYETDITKIRPTRSQAYQNQRNMMQSFGASFTPSLVLVTGLEPAETLQRAQTIIADLKSLVHDGHLARVSSLVEWIPSPKRQAENLAVLQQFEMDGAVFLDAVQTGLKQKGLKPQAFQDGFDRALASIQLQSPLRPDTLPILGKYLSRFYHTEAGGETSVLISCYPRENDSLHKWKELVQGRLEKYPDVCLTGPVVISQELKQIVWDDAAFAAIVGTIAVFVLLSLYLGSVLKGFLGLLPVLLGILWQVGLMGIFGINVNFVNIFVFTMMLGVGVDYGLHFVHRWTESNGGMVHLSATGKAIAIAALTTMAGFGSLATSHYPGLRSMGVMALFGAFCCALISLTLLPALLKLYRGSSED